MVQVLIAIGILAIVVGSIVLTARSERSTAKIALLLVEAIFLVSVGFFLANKINVRETVTASGPATPVSAGPETTQATPVN